MPTLPRLPDQRVEQAPVQTPRVGADLSLEAYGGGQTAQQVAGEARGLGNDVRALALQARDKADALRLSEQRRALNDWEQSNLYDPNNGAFAKVGKDAIGIQSSTLTSFDKFAQEQGKALSNERQKQMYQDMVDARRAHMGQTLGGHELQQGKVFEHDELNAGIESAKSRASNDPSTAPLELNIIKDNVDQKAKSFGWGDKEKAAELAKHQSDLHLGILSKMVASGNDLQAKDYYTANEKAFWGNDAPRAAGLVKRSSTLGEAQRIEDAVFNTTYDEKKDVNGEIQEITPRYAPTTQKDAMDRVLELTKNSDPEVRKTAEQLVLNRYHRNVQAQKEEQENTFQAVAAEVRKSGKLPSVDVLDSLDEQHREHLDMVVSRMAKTGSPYAAKDDPHTLTEFYAIPREAMMNKTGSDMELLAGKLTEGSYKDAVKHWEAARNKDDQSTFTIKAEDEKNMFEKARDAGLAGLRKNDQQGKLGNKADAYNEIADEGRKRLRAEAELKNNKLSQEDRQRVIGDLIVEKRAESAAPKIASFEMLGHRFSLEFGKSDLQSDERQRIIDSVRRITGSDPSDKKIHILYQARKLGVKEDVWRRLAEAQ